MYTVHTHVSAYDLSTGVLCALIYINIRSYAFPATGWQVIIIIIIIIIIIVIIIKTSSTGPSWKTKVIY